MQGCQPLCIGVVRSLHPTHSIAACGRGAAAYLAGELENNTPCTPGGCYDRLREVGGKILLLGVSHARNTFLHSVEDFVKLEQAYLDCGAAKNTKFGDAACVLGDANGLFRVTRHVLAPDPEAFVTEPVVPAQRWKDMCVEPF